MRKISLEKGFIENKTFRRCQQVQCGHFTKGGCKSCADCNAEPLILKKSCQRCLRCEGVPGEIRWDDPKAQEQAKAIQQENEEMENRVKEMIFAGGGMPPRGRIIVIEK